MEVLGAVIDDILLIENEHRHVLAYISNLEQKRKNVQNLVQGLGNDVCTTGAKDRLIDIIDKLKFKIAEDCNENVVKTKESEKKCRYYNKGYCKNKLDCKFYHPESVCENFLLNKSCPERGCTKRHPSSCKFWQRGPRGCFRGETCKYLHRLEDMGKDKKELCDGNKSDNEIRYNCPKPDDDDPLEKAKEDTEREKESERVAMEKTKSKENILSHESEKRNLEDEITKLKYENVDLIAQLEKLKRVLAVMDKQLKLIKGKK